MTALVLLGTCAVILAAASIFVVGVAVGFGIARRRYQSPAVMSRLSPPSTESNSTACPSPPEEGDA